tara:strand:+ start:5871 stop:6689 length:819 start_codon:yes stop_codon:yes gene_type:complete
MLNSNEINFFQKNGYIILKNHNKDSLNYIQKKIFNLLKDKKLEKTDPLLFFKNFHKKIKKTQLNDVRLRAINAINHDKLFRDHYFKVGQDTLESLVGNELAMQKKINLSLQIPNDKKSMLPMHSDIYAGESPFEVVMWIPLTNVKKTTHSMFITNPKDNIKINEEVTQTKSKTIMQIFNKYRDKFKFLEVKFGEILIFTPILLHGNVVNKTKETRISLNCRFKSLLSPYDVFSKTHRNIPHFYKPLNIKPLTSIGFNFIDSVNKKKFDTSEF